MVAFVLTTQAYRRCGSPSRRGLTIDSSSRGLSPLHIAAEIAWHGGGVIYTVGETPMGACYCMPLRFGYIYKYRGHGCQGEHDY